MSAKRPDLVINAGWIVPVVPRGTVLKDHSLLIADGRILQIQPHGGSFPDARVVDLPGQMLIPGLINMHGHAAMSLLRGVADDLPLMTWLENHIWPLEAALVDERFCRVGSRLAIAEMISSGITCANDMYFFPEVLADEACAAGFRASLGMIMLDFPTAYGDGPEDYLSRGLALHDRIQGEALLQTCFAPHAPYTVSDAPLQKIRVLADELDVPVHIHLHETEFEIHSAVENSGQRPLQRLDDLGLVNRQLLAVHATQLTAAEIRRLAEAGSSVVHCPESNLKLASGFCPVADLLDAGVNVCLGTDGAASNNDLNLLGEARTAALIGKAVAGQADALPAATMLEMMTINAAQALGRDHDLGSLEPGKWADFCAVDYSGLNQQPLFDPVSQLIYATDRNCVSQVWVAGRCLLRDGRLQTIDEAQLRGQVEDYAQRIHAQRAKL